MSDNMTTDLTDAELVEKLRRAAMIWFKNSDLLLLEELIRRHRYYSRVVSIYQRGDEVR
jgi:hypothetical protein